MPRPEYRGPGTKIGDKVILPFSAARANFGRVVNYACHGGKRYLITFRGRPTAVVVGIEDLRRLEEAEQSGFF